MNKIINRLARTVAAVVLTLNLTGIAPFLTQPVNAAALCTIATTTIDAQGPNDEPGQKDLSLYCLPGGDAAGELTVSWQWDEIAWSGSNTGDTCALFDTNGNNLSNYAVCVTVSGNPAVKVGNSPRIYTCNDSALEKCAGGTLVVGPYQTVCTVSQSATDPFSGPPNKKEGASYPNDTSASCTIKLSEVGGGVAVLKDVCSFPSQQPNSSPSDCIITSTGNPNPVIELKKDIAPNSDTGRFNLRIDLATDAIATNQGDGGTTGEYEFSTTSVLVEETAYTGSNLANYTTQLVCVDDTDPAVPFLNIAVAGSTSRTATISPPNGVVDITCTFVNTRIDGSVKVVKDVINDNGGIKTSADFTFTNNGGAAQPFVTTTSPDGEKVLSLPVGSSFSIVEVQANTGGYATSYTGTCSGTVTVAEQVCTITNNDQQGSLTINKTVVNDNGGNAQASDFSFKKSGDAANHSFINGATTLVGSKTFAINAGTYSAVENTFPGYTMTGNTCTNVVVANGGTASCTITNDDNAATLTVVKNVINDNGGTATVTDFGITNNNSGLTFGTGVVIGSTTTYTSTPTVLSNTNYTLSEIDLAGYAEGIWTCNDSTTGTGRSVTVNLDESENVTCTVTNEDVTPVLTILKQVLNPYGTALPASSFPLFVDNTSVTSGVATSQFNAGTHTVTETQQTGYTFTSFTGTNCSYTDGIMSVLLSLAGNTTCTITNTAVQPKLTVTKVVINDNGGSKVISDFPLFVNQTSVTSGIQNGFNTGNYTISETSDPGYESSITGDCSGNDEITLNLGDVKSCIITNNDIAPKLKLVKTVINDNGGTKVVSDFALAINGNTVVSGQPNTLSANVLYTASETNLPGYAASVWGGDCATNGTITLAPGDHKTCSITNSDVAPQLTVIKHVINDNGGTATASQFEMQVTGTNVSDAAFPGNEDGTTVTLNAGAFSVAESGPGGYGGSLGNDCGYSIAVGQHKVCTITNDDIAPSLTLNKVVSNTHGGTAAESAWTLTASGPTLLSGAGATGGTDVVSDPTFKAGTYTLSESTGPAGYSASAWTCTNNVAVVDFKITLAPGQTTVCSITNSDVAPTLTLVKTAINDNGGTKTAVDFQGMIDGNNVAWSTATALSAGAHAATETTLPTYAASVWGGDCAANGTITLEIGQNKTCSITNDDKAPVLTLNKILVDTFGGSYTEASWLLTADGAVTDLSGNGAAGSTDVVSGSGFYAGSYTLSESGPTTGITSGSWNCGDTTVTSNVIALALGQVVSCTITNTTVQPNITLVKAIDGNQYGDTSTINEFGLTIGGSAVTSGTAYGKNVGTYAINEAGKDGYSFVSITGGAKCPAALGGTVSLALGDDITCTITNTAVQPKLTVTKVVINDNGGNKVISDFPLFVNQTSVTSGVQNGFNTGSYTVSETNQTGYVGTIGGDCSTNGSISLSLGDVKTCTITNDDIAPKLTLYKEVVNDNSGVSEAVDWTLTATPAYDDEEQTGNTLSGNGEDGFVNKEVAAHVTYTLSENGPDGYTAGEWYCYSEGKGVFSSPDGYNNQIRMREGADVTCTITNNDNPNPEINVVKSGPDTAYEGDEVNYMFVVTNTGDIALDGINVQDDIAGDGVYLYGDTNNNGILETTEAWTYTALYIVPANQIADVVNTVIAYGYAYDETQNNYEDSYRSIITTAIADEYSYANEEECFEGAVCDTDTHTLDILHPALNVVKSGPKSSAAGSTVSYTFTVTNTGDVALNGLTVVDSITGDGTYVSGDTNDDDMLDITETWVYSAKYTIPVGQVAPVINTVTVCGYDLPLYLERPSARLLNTNGYDDTETTTVQIDPRVKVCDTGTHTLTIPQVLSTSTSKPKLVNAGSPLLNMYTVAALVNIAAVLTIVAFNKKQNAKTTK